ncbi:hypothetical protein [Rhodococcus sp. NPDC057529]|uniref:MmyB family transcriptional regulator n=1 Tax=Rhodococcus sp. NPDC057529 TaxID=3346158 RepID=UPI00366A7782
MPPTPTWISSSGPCAASSRQPAASPTQGGADDMADFSLAMFHVAAGKNPYDRDLTDLIGELATRSEDFRVRWAAHDLHEHQTGVKRVHRSLVGDMSQICETPSLPKDPRLIVCTNTAEPGSTSVDALRLLSAWHRPMNQLSTRPPLRNKKLTNPHGMLRVHQT